MSNALKRIKAIIGHSYTYQGQEHLLLDWSLDGDQLVLETDQQPIKLHLAHVPAFLLELEAVNAAADEALEGIERARQNTSMATQTSVEAMLPTQALAQINELLLDSIRQVQKDPAYIPQAKQISDSVQVVVNVAKLQIEAGKLVLQAQRRK